MGRWSGRAGVVQGQQCDAEEGEGSALLAATVCVCVCVLRDGAQLGAQHKTAAGAPAAVHSWCGLLGLAQGAEQPGAANKWQLQGHPQVWEV